MANELDRLTAKDSITNAMLGTKDAKIEILSKVAEMRQNQLIFANSEILKLEKDKKALQRKVLAYKIGSIIAILTTIIILK